MKTVIYADVLITVNFIVNYLLLRAVSVLFSIKHSTFRLLLSSLLGGFYSLIIFVENIPTYLNFAINILILSLLVLIAFKLKNIKDFMRYLMAFFLSNFLFAGIMLAVNILCSSNKILYKNGIVYFDINFITLIFTSLFCYLVITVISRFVSNRAVNKLIYDIELFYGDKSVNAKALLDTGNNLKEVFSGKPVIVAERSTAKNIFPDKSDITELKNFRLIPFSTISSSGALPAFLLNKVNVNNGGKIVEVNGVYLAVSDKKIVSSDYSVLLGNAFINAVR